MDQGCRLVECVKGARDLFFHASEEFEEDRAVSNLLSIAERSKSGEFVGLIADDPASVSHLAREFVIGKATVSREILAQGDGVAQAHEGLAR